MICESWPVDLECCRGLPDDVDPALVERWARVASEILWAKSGRRWGPSCPVTVRPCKRSCWESIGEARWSPVLWGSSGGRIPYIGVGGGWFNATCGCSSDCSCGELCEVRLEGPVYDIVEVWDNGELLVPDQYRLDRTDRGLMLVRTDGGCWPSCQDMAAECDQPGAFAVTYRLGLPLDATAIAAVSELTCEFVKACTEGCDCRLPGNVRRVVRQGVTVEMADPTTIFAENRTGLPLVDLWLDTVNPNRLPAPPRVRGTNVTRPRRTPVCAPTSPTSPTSA